MATEPSGGPGFAGAHTLLALIKGLTERPRFLARPPAHELRGDQPLPLLCLQRESGANGFLAALAQRLDEALPPKVPYAFVNADTAQEQSRERWTTGDSPDVQPLREAMPLLPLLDVLSFSLAADRFGTGRLTRFNYYRLADWLTGQPLPPPQGRNDQPVVRLLRQWSGRQGQPPDTAEVSSGAMDLASGGLTRFGLRLALWAGRRVGFRWLEKRVPGLRQESRWFTRRQNYMIPRHSVSFLGFAERLTLSRRDSENLDQIKKLHVHAFLEDLRIAYRRRRWMILPKRKGWRRTAYLTVLLDNVTEDNGGWELLQLINEVRNETGELDPLFVVAASDEAPPAGAGINCEIVDPAEADLALSEWRRTLPGRRQQLVKDARFFRVRLPRPVDPCDARSLPRGDRTAWETDAVFRPRPAPVLARRGLVELALVLALLVPLVPAFQNVRDYWGANCSYFRPRFTDGVSVKLVRFAPGDLQCIGYSDNDSQIFGADERLRNAQEAIFEQNRLAARLHEEDPARPYIGIVYFVGLTHRGAAPDTDDAFAEELEGMLLRQRQQNVKSKSEPVLRVIIANGGVGMKKAPQVVRDMLRPLFQADHTVLGVLGLDRTVVETEEAITQLGLAGIPTIGSTLTGTGLADRSPLYFQLVPGNPRQAELLTRYAQHVNATKVTIYHPQLKQGDTYVDTLVEAVHAQLGSAGVSVVDEHWKYSPRDLDSLCSTAADRSDEIIYYAGREDYFGDFLSGVTRCYNRTYLPRIVADDSIYRFIAQEKNRKNTKLAGLPVSYVGMGSLVTLAGRPCLDGKPAPLVGGGTPLDAFCAGYSELHKELDKQLSEDEDPALLWPAELSGLAYDGAGLFVEAMDQIQRRLKLPPGSGQPHRAAVAQQFREMTFKGATGAITFADSRVGEDRNLAILEVDNIYDLKSQPRCVYLIGDLFEKGQPRNANGCPSGGKAKGTADKQTGWHP
ncbi:hypothetical protein F7R91_29230 [Streptomyces luteolifulvus]|uniref:Leucine-binding protein domain-containing protein n=1 Tax=Streptomyces luteolifulvus TaxID=2615112 RepID=A0A6H9USI4_9ACTN|nr:hypothetical protein [Streptomyces luteolifulvus]KAB1142335.1 hypothetical protein F7R91_29230 [Streptomyces luteolifulvus]